MSYSMKTNPSGTIARISQTVTGLMMLILVFAAPLAHANTTADATIFNEVTVNFEDFGGNPLSATADTSVTVNTVEAATSISGRPTNAAPGTSAALPGEQTLADLGRIASGITATYLFSVTANANGDDAYSTVNSVINTQTDVTGITLSYQAADATGSPTGALGAAVTLDAGVIVGVTATDTLDFPGGSLAGTLVAGDIVVVNGRDYAVVSVTPGNAESSGVAEVNDVVVLGINVSGFNVAPAFTNGGSAAAGDALIGSVMGEQLLVQVTVTADANNPPAIGIVGFDLEFDPGTSPTTVTDHRTEYIPIDLTITKQVSNVAGGPYAATANQDPGGILEYEVVVANTGGDATVVVVTDAVPTYTTLVTHTVYGDQDDSGTVFAQATDGVTTVDLTSVVDVDNASITSGDQAGITASSTLTFHVGATNNGTTGGTVSLGDTFTIIYQVRID